MSTPAAITGGPEISDATVTFRFADPDRALTGLRLSQDVRIPGDRLDFSRGDDGDWTLQVVRPDVDRMEYSFELTHPDGRTEHVLDPTNDATAPGAFGDKSVVLLPGYEPPDWLGVDAAGVSRELGVAARALGTELPVWLWSPRDTADDEPLPLLAVHDGPEYDELAALTSYLGTMAGRGTVPRRDRVRHPGLQPRRLPRREHRLAPP